MPKIPDPLCPLGFHPQVRWPTRCKRCFRDYKDHLNKKEVEPSAVRRQESADEPSPDTSSRGVYAVSRGKELGSIGRRNTTELPLSVIHSEPSGGATKTSTDDKETEKAKDYSSIYSTISAPALARLSKFRGGSASQDVSSSSSGDESEAILRRKRVQIHSLREVPAAAAAADYNSPDVQFILEVKRSNAKAPRSGSSDDESLAETDITETTTTTETTLVETNFCDLQEQVNDMRKELDKYKTRCERLEREKDELTKMKKTRGGGPTSLTINGTGSESMRLQQRIRELETVNEDLIDDKRSAELRASELERDLETRPSATQTHKMMEDLRAKSSAAEALIEELMEENEDLKKEMRQMVDEMEELQDNFREDQADEYRDLKKDLEQTAKNCRILQFKLRKSERRMETLETEKHELESTRTPGGASSASPSAHGQDRIKALEQELAQSRDQLAQAQRELINLQSQLRTANKDPVPQAGPVLSKSRSLEGTSSGRHKTEELTTLQRDLQDALEREADLREQLKFAEEEAQSLRKKLSRVEEENESLVMQLKKMALKKGRRTTPDTSIDKDEGISDDMDDLSLSELRLQLELNEQETAILRRKMEDMEGENDRLSREVLELQELVKVSPSGSSDPARSKSSKDQEMAKLKVELMEKNKEIVHLNEALTQAEKSRSKVVVQRSRSLEGESSLDLKRQLQLVEQEATILRTKTHELEAENDKMSAENRRLHLRVSRKGAPSDSEKLLLDKLELEERIKALEKKLAEIPARGPATAPSGSPRSSRSSGRLSPNDAPETSVLRREKEILEKDVNNKEDEIANLKSRVQQLEKDRDAKGSLNKIPQRVAKKPADTMTKLQLKKMAEELETEITDLLARVNVPEVKPEVNEAWNNQKKTLESKIAKLEQEIDKNQSAIADAKSLKDKCDKLEAEKNELKTKLDSSVDLDTLHQVKQEKHKLQKELTEKETRLSDMERKLKDVDDKNKRNDRIIKDNKDRIQDLEKEELRAKEELKKGLDAATRKAEREIKSAKDEAANFKTKLDDMEQKLTRVELDRKASNDRIQRQEADWRKERDQLIGRATDFEVELKTEKKKRDRCEKEHEQDMRDKDDEMMGLRERLKRCETEAKVATDRYESLKNQDGRSRELELELERQLQEYNELTAKYEVLEGDYLTIKGKLIVEKDKLEREHTVLKKEHDTVEGELRTLRETFNLRQDTWIKEKLDMQDKVKGLEDKEKHRQQGDTGAREKTRLFNLIEEKNQQLDKANRDVEVHVSRMEDIRKENEELRRKLEDFDKVTKVSRAMTFDSSQHDREIRDLKNKLSNEEKAHRSEMTHTRMRLENRIALLQEESQNTQTQLEKARRERDTLRDMLDGAQRMIATLKSDPNRKSGIDAMRSHEMEENLARIEEFHAKITGLEDELNEARSETSRVKTEQINERSSKDIKLSELQTKINELEEDKIMAMGRSRITGTRTRLELAWQKERDEQQRIIQETSTLARDLRQTLLEMEKERDRDRLESRRRLEQLKRSNEEEQVDIRNKVDELQEDLVELRETHAKLRTSCEKLRRDKDRVERDRDDAKRLVANSRKAESDAERRVAQLLAEVQKMKDLCPLVLGETLRGGEKTLEHKRDKDIRQEKVREEFMNSLRHIDQCGEDIRRLQQQRDGEDINKRTTSFRRAMSSVPDDGDSRSGAAPIPAKRTGGAYRRSLSVEQRGKEKDNQSTSSYGHGDDDDYGSVYYGRNLERDISLDRLSNDSMRSDSFAPATPETKKKKGLVGKLKMLTSKSRQNSLEDSGTANYLVTAGIQALLPSVNPTGSDMSLADSEADRRRPEKKSVKSKITGIFKSLSRNNSVERSNSTDRSTPAKEVISSSSSSERPLQRPPSLSRSVTPNILTGRATPSRTVASRGTLRNQNSIETNV